jgi:penicillin-insensitive murein endopeptidase
VRDGTTISYGLGTAGALGDGIRLAQDGDGYWIPPRWWERGNNYGTEELVTLIVRVARRVQRESSGPPLGVADLSPAAGGPSLWHRSHQSGRDVDLLFFTRSPGGAKLRTTAMLRFKDDGVARGSVSTTFDVARNWVLVRALVEETSAEVQHIFVYEPLEHLLLDHARAVGEPEALVARAAALMSQPADSARHDDHFHVRVYGAESARSVGCQDHGQLRWTKKGYKYGFLTRFATMATGRRSLAVAGLGSCVALAASWLGGG